MAGPGEYIELDADHLPAAKAPRAPRPSPAIPANPFEPLPRREPRLIDAARRSCLRRRRGRRGAAPGRRPAPSQRSEALSPLPLFQLDARRSSACRSRSSSSAMAVSPPALRRALPRRRREQHREGEAGPNRAWFLVLVARLPVLGERAREVEAVETALLDEDLADPGSRRRAALRARRRAERR